MVKYSIETDFRNKVAYLLAFLSILSVSVVNYLITEMRLTWLIAPPSAFALFLAYYLFYDKFIWRFLSKLHNVPDLNGKWEGRLNRGVNHGETEGKESNITAEIKQTWTEIDIVFKGSKSISRPKVVTFFNKNPGHIELHYGYEKSPLKASVTPDRRGIGYTILRLHQAPDNKKLDGHYFSDNHRSGSMELEFKSD